MEVSEIRHNVPVPPIHRQGRHAGRSVFADLEAKISKCGVDSSFTVKLSKDEMKKKTPATVKVHGRLSTWRKRGYEFTLRSDLVEKRMVHIWVTKIPESTPIEEIVRERHVTRDQAMLPIGSLTTDGCLVNAA